MIQMPQIKYLTALALATLLASAANGEPLFFDSFESGDMSATNADGFDWSNNNRTSVVTADAAVYNNGTINNPIGSSQNWDPKDGQHSLRFRYPAGEPWAEQRFNLGGAYPEIWIKYWIRVPVNYQHGTGNYKFLSLWMDDYNSTAGGKITWEFWPTDIPGDSVLAFAYDAGNGAGNSGHKQHTPFINASEDRGKWMEIVIHAKTSSGGEPNDGVIELWRRWEGEESYTQFHKKTDTTLAIPVGGPDGWNGGFLLGWANNSYSEATEWLLDSFEVSTSSLLTGSAATDLMTNPPNPPILKIN
jgi:hypothetical protein